MRLKRVFIGICSVFIFPHILAYPLNAASSLTADEARAIAAEAFVYGFAPVLLESYRLARAQVMDGVNRMAYVASSDVHRTMGYFAGYLDLSGEPMVLCLPDMQGQRILLEFIDAYDNIVPVRGRSPQGNPGCSALTGPGWKGRLPGGMTEVRFPTNGAWVFGRSMQDGAWDREAFEASLGRCSLTPLSLFTKGIRNAPAATGAGLLPCSPVRQVLLMDMQAFFGRLALFMRRTSPPDADAAVISRMTGIGIDPRNGFFDTTRLSPAARKAIEQGMKNGMDDIRRYVWEGSPEKEGWRVVSPPPYGTDYLKRSAAAYASMGEPLTGGTTIAVCRIDGAGNRLSGAGRYVLHLENGWPQADKANWSLTVVDVDLSPLSRRMQHTALSSLDGLQRGADGSIDIAVQKDSPVPGREMNWLEVPEGDFALMLRAYGTGESSQTGGHPYPPVQRREE